MIGFLLQILFDVQLYSRDNVSVIEAFLVFIFDFYYDFLLNITQYFAKKYPVLLFEALF